MMRTLGIDYGTKRVGLALSDAGGKFATPLEVIQISRPQLAIDSILKILEREGVERIVVGLPLNMDDSIGSAARSVISWAKQLSSRSGNPVIFVDERLSSFAAEQTLIDRKRGGEKITRKSKQNRLDAHAAVGFLRDFLDGKLEAIDLAGR